MRMMSIKTHFIMATVPKSSAVFAFDSRADNFYLINSATGEVSTFSTEGGVTISVSGSNVAAVTGDNGGETIFTIDISDKWIGTSFDPSSNRMAAMGVGNGMIETNRVSTESTYGSTTSVSSYYCDLGQSKSVTLIKSGNIVSCKS